MIQRRFKRRFWPRAAGLAFLLVVGALVVARSAEGPAAWQFGPLGCRLSYYGKNEAAGWDHIQAIGLHYVFLAVPAAADAAAVEKKLAEHHMKCSVLRGAADLSTPTSVDGMASQFETCRRLGVRYLFLSPKHPGVSKEDACLRLHRAGELAAKYGVIISLETHPDLGTNAAEHLATMRRVNHPNVRVNFDAGNIRFYNQDLNPVDELKKVADYVAMMEIKDHFGQPQQWNFPALGRGAIDIPGVLRVLAEHRFAGPVTIEVEGVRGVKWSAEETKLNMAESVAYLRRLANFDH